MNRSMRLCMYSQYSYIFQAPKYISNGSIVHYLFNAAINCNASMIMNTIAIGWPFDAIATNTSTPKRPKIALPTVTPSL